MFFRDCIFVETHLPHHEAIAYVLPHFDALTRMMIHVSSAFIFAICLLKAYVSICVCQGFVYFGLNLHIFSFVHHCLWKMCATPVACIKPGLVQRPLCHKVNLPNCVAGRPLCHTK